MKRLTNADIMQAPIGAFYVLDFTDGSFNLYEKRSAESHLCVMYWDDGSQWSRDERISEFSNDTPVYSIDSDNAKVALAVRDLGGGRAGVKWLADHMEELLR